MVIAKSEYPEVREKMAFFAQKKPNLFIIEDLRKIFQEPNITAKKYSALALGTIKDKNSILYQAAKNDIPRRGRF